MKKNNKFLFLGIIATLVFILVTNTASAQTYAQVSSSSTLKVGSKGAGVTALQQFLASNHDLYPGALVTGYFGSMTKAAVVQFQLAYGLAADGIAGAMTKNKMNSLISAGRGLDLYAPSISNLSVGIAGKNATVAFNTSEPAMASAFYDTNVISIADSGVAFGPVAISGAQVLDNTFTASKQMYLNNLSGNTNYNYAVRVTDASGNISLSWPSVFQTAQ